MFQISFTDMKKAVDKAKQNKTMMDQRTQTLPFIKRYSKEIRQIYCMIYVTNAP